MGTVYRALDVKLERLVALKFLPDPVLASDTERERFLREARTASLLDHPNIGVIHGVEETPDGRPFIVMAFYEGETLARRISRGPLALTEAVVIAIQVARGLTEAHTRAVIHRDIKPGNILLTQQNVAKIVDFGLARMNVSTGSTQTLGTSGTIGYMSPEQTLDKVVDQRTDIWALGVVTAEMVIGKNPFWRASAPATIAAILNEAPTLPEEISLDLRHIIYRALSKDPATRYPQCSEMLSDLEVICSAIERGMGQVLSGQSPPGGVGFREAVAHASQELWVPLTSQTKRSMRWLGSFLLLVVLLVLLLLIPGVHESITNLFGREEQHIAVLPFEDVGGNPANDPVSEGLMDSLSSKLTNLDVGKQSLWVVPTSEIRRLKVADPQTALRQLGATIVVKGSISREGKDIRLTLNLIDTKTLRQVGSAALEDRAGDLVTLQDEAVARVARLMHMNVNAEMLRNTGGAVTPSAYEGYLKALGYLQRYDKAGNLDAAIAALNSAVKSDPRFALGFAELGEAYRLKYVTESNPKWVDEALANCQKAAQLDDRLPAVYVTLGRLHSSTGKHDLAIQEFQHALRLNSRDPDALSGIAHAYENAGRMQDAEENFKKASALRPDSWIGYNDLGLFYDRQGKYDESIAAFRKAVELTPDNAQAYLNLGATLIDTGDKNRAGEAERVLKKSIDIRPSYQAYANLGQLYYLQKRYSQSALMTENALRLNDNNYLVWNNLANAYLLLKEDNKAAVAIARTVELAEKASELNPQDAIAHCKLAALYAQRKLRDKAIPRIQAALVLSPDDPYVLGDVATAYEYLGDRAKAIEYAKSAIRKGYAVEQFSNTPDMQDLIRDPKFPSQSQTQKD